MKRVLLPTATTLTPVATMKSGVAPFVGCVGELHATTTTDIMPTETDWTLCTGTVPHEQKIPDTWNHRQRSASFLFVGVQFVHAVGIELAARLISNAAQVMAPKSKTKAKTIDEYLAALDDDKRAALQKLRKTIRAAAPNVEECISYQLPAFRLNGKLLVAFGATASHCAFYPMSASTVAAFKDELEDFDTSKGTIRFQPGNPLPAALVRKLVRARIAENRDAA